LGLHGAVVLFALAGIIGKALALPPTVVVAGRSAGAAVTLFALIALQGRLRHLPRSGLIVVSGVVLAVHWATFFQSIVCAGVSVALVSYSTYPLALLLMEVCWFRVMPSLNRWVAGGLILIGMVLLVPELDVSNQAVLGALWGIGSGALFALYTLTNRRLAEAQEPIAIAASQNAVSALCILPVALYLTETIPLSFGLRELALLAFLGAVCTGLAHTWFIASLARVGAGAASMVASLEAVHGVALAWILLGEIPALQTLVGGVIILGAVVLGTRVGHKRPQPAAAQGSVPDATRMR
jgi:drug/metabolite transporter (DMT)-like permease